MNEYNTQIPENMESPYGDAGKEIRRHLGIMRDRFWTIFACLVIVFSISAIRAFRATDVYEASARIMVQRRHPAVTPFDDDSMRSIPGEQYETHMQLIRSREVLERALENPELAALYETEEPSLERERPGLIRTVLDEARSVFSSEPTRERDPWERLRGRINTSRVSDTDLMDISISGTNPNTCALIANSVAEAYESYAIEMRRRTAGETFESLQDLKDQQEDILQEAEEALYSFHDVDSDDEDGPNTQMETIESRLSALNSELTSLQMQLMDLEISTEVVEKAGADIDREDIQALRRVARSVDDDDVSEVLSKLQEIELERAEIPTGYGPKHPEVARLEARRSVLMKQLSDAVEDYADILAPRIEMLRHREEALKQGLDEQNRLRQQKQRSLIGLERLEKDVQRHEQFYEVILERMRQVDMGKDAEVANVHVVEQAAVPVSPVRPDRQRAVLLGLMLGLFVGVGMAYVHEWLDDTITNPDDLEYRVNLPVLGYVPTIETTGMDDDFVEAAQHNLMSPNSPLSELFRSIRTNVYFSGAKDKKGSSLVVVSAHPEGGKTVFSSNLAVTLARDNNRVLLVDADLRRSKIHQAFGLDKSPGLTNVLIGEKNLEDIVVSPEDSEGNVLENLHILCAGSKSPNPAELIGGESMEKFMAEVRHNYDMVIYDTGASLMIADTTILAGRSDGAIMLIQAGQCRIRLLEKVKQQLNMVNCPIVGTVLNKVHRRTMRASYGYGGYYGYGYGYGYGYYDEEEETENA